MTYTDMAEDVIRYADQHKIEQIAIVGHNMGAKLGMTTSCMFSDRVSAIVSLDTPPICYSGNCVQETKEYFEKIKGL